MPVNQGDTITRQTIIDEFNRIVVDQLKNRGAATWYKGTVPGPYPTLPAAWKGPLQASNIINHADLGPRAEPNKTLAELQAQFSPPSSGTDNSAIVTNVFDALYRLARQLTRVRKARYRYRYGASNYLESSTTELTALVPGKALGAGAFPNTNPPAKGEVATLSSLTEYLRLLRDQVNTVRENNSLAHTFTACHSNTKSPPPCHGSRGRR